MQRIPPTHLIHVSGGSPITTIPASFALGGWTPRNIPVITPPQPRPPVA